MNHQYKPLYSGLEGHVDFGPLEIVGCLDCTGPYGMMNAQGGGNGTPPAPARILSRGIAYHEVAANNRENTLFSFDYTFHPVTGNLTSRYLHDTEEHFFYDTDGKHLNRLAGTGPDENTVSETYNFADNGNITSKDRENRPVSSSSFSSQPF